jgi:malonyl-CoA/methylmalonyl-CoA synthetase
MKKGAIMSQTTFKDWFETACAAHKDDPAITFLRWGDPETTLTYRQLNGDADRMAHGFMDMGVEKGDRVVLFMAKSLAFVVAHLALQKIGAISVPLNPGFKRSEMAYLLSDADPNVVLCDPDKREMIADLCPGARIGAVDPGRPYPPPDLFLSDDATPVSMGLSPDDPALIIYTSGTTGNPKGAMLTQGNLAHDARNIIKIWEISSSDVLCHALPLFHVHGLCFALHTVLLAGGRVMLLDGFVPGVVLDALARKDADAACTVFMAVPAMYAKLMDTLEDRRPDFSHIRLWTSGSAPLLAKEFQRIREVFGKEPVEREGMSETGMNFSNPVRGERKAGSIGVPLPGVDVRIVNPETFGDVDPGQVGELWLRSPSITPGYWRKPNETADTFHDDWFRTGDLGNVDEDGYYCLTDRIKHIIITGGENVSAKEVETVVDGVDGVAESSVVGIPDEKWGEKVVAAVKLKPGAEASADAIQAACKEKLHDWKCPKEIRFVSEIPRNTMGKVLKEAVKGMFETE